ncbi:3-phenylpropionate/cinnamic acid dioxygenase subunit beta [Actinobacteria bacterium YIM 96077]|uniref:Aromatic-ring-hydroxylating dioxygenase subunit beta n=1 Tax=Phytoactinopolyspora halophila TaxID=1981511 RepID=A0A329QVX5_9ACTN|nr:3-phenylpropionate/cinnamic acid dioxygenase subunit beta [Phytoactinopolyspora halophila]AYY15005.1 3-phenylpropionate/cinnamic acid dioxygenase subunit beta [Actinobacteria bacterium YIM 96077]RAW15462.1 aromatic-ring-hydroxylating dioxygenase subunit beta [Phytoactinopolyspora halophila]
MTVQLAGVDRDVRESIRDFLYLEALALDERRFRDWLEMFADDARYEVPVRVTREKLSEWELSPNSRIFDDTKETLDVRVKRLETDFAWSEQPPSRTRHFVTNVLVQPGERADEFLVLSNCMIYRSRGDETTPSLFSAQRRDVLRENGDGWLIVHRWAALDQAVVNAHNMSIFI